MHPFFPLSRPLQPQRVIMTSNSNVVEALDTLYCPQDRIVQVGARQAWFNHIFNHSQAFVWFWLHSSSHR